MFVGIDISKKSLTWTLLETPQTLHVFGETVVNAEAGFKHLIKRVARFVSPVSCQFITENTGVYGEHLYYFCHRQNLPVYREPAHFIRRAFRLKRKTDQVDSRMIAEYGFRYRDQLHQWNPPDPLLEQINVLMVNRDLYQRELSAHHNITKALGEKERSHQHTHDEACKFFNQQMAQIEKQMLDLLKTNGEWYQHCINLDTIPGVGLLYTLNFLILTEGFHNVDYRSLAGYLGICPYEFESGESVYKRPRSDKKGPDRMRRQLYVSVMSALACKEENFLKVYYQRKTAEGKRGKIIMNNLGNKLLRLSCAVVLGRKPYDKHFKSIRTNL